MSRKKGGAPKAPKPRTVKYSLLAETHKAYEILRKARDKWHQDIERAKIALAWWKNVKADKDGRVTIAKVHHTSDLTREVTVYDFIILLNEAIWNDKEWTEKQKLAVMDHELCHIAVVVDKDGQVKVDDRNRYLFRMRKHDIEEFREIVKRHGCYKSDLEAFAKVLQKKMDAPLVSKMDEAAPDEPVVH